jgi:hypothetical protein
MDLEDLKDWFVTIAAGGFLVVAGILFLNKLLDFGFHFGI